MAKKVICKRIRNIVMYHRFSKESDSEFDSPNADDSICDRIHELKKELAKPRRYSCVKGIHYDDRLQVGVKRIPFK